MDYEKARLTPVNDDKNAPDNAAGQSAKELIRRQRQETQRYKQKYFELYDDVKINHREDW